MNVEASFWKYVVWVDFGERANANWSDCEFVALRFTNVLGLDEEKLELLYEQFYDYKTINDAKLPKETYEEALLLGTSDGHNKEYRLDVIWYYLRKMRSPVGPNYRFKLLLEVSRIVLTIPHSSAGTERVFSYLLTRIKMRVQIEMSSILTVKLERPESKEKRYLYKRDKELLRNARKTTIKANIKDHTAQDC